MSLPTSRKPSPAASAAAPPPVDPPGVRVRSQGLFDWPATALYACQSAAHSGVFVLPTITAPAALSRATTTASSSGTCCSSSFAPAVVRTPLVA
jgi:hypothetical protein